MTRDERRAATARMRRCDCGNTARYGEMKCGACLDEELRKRQADDEFEEKVRGIVAKILEERGL